MPSTPQRLWLCTQPVGMRCSFDGLTAVVRQPAQWRWRVFVNRRRRLVRVLYFEPGGYCLWSKRLEQGHFAMPQVGDQPVRALSATVFESLLEGLDIEVKKNSANAGSRMCVRVQLVLQ
jgi:transposase